MGWSLSKSIWKRANSRATDELGQTAYLGAVTGFTVYGLALASGIAIATMAWRPESILVWLLIGLGVPIIGILISSFSQNWFFSFIGYNMVVAGLGAISGPSVAMLESAVVINALVATAGVTVVCSIVGLIYPKSLESWGGYLFGALIALVFVRIAQAIMIGMGFEESVWYMPWIEYAAAVLFSLYIIYDWNRALRLPHTLDNAVDVAVAIFLDIINLFWTIVNITNGDSD